jgi:hypothetical protein
VSGWRRPSQLNPEAQPPSHQAPGSSGDSAPTRGNGLVTRITIHQETPSRLLRRDLQCVARSIEVNLTSHQSLVSIERLHATDMAGTIRAIQQLDPDVTRIDVFCHARLTSRMSTRTPAGSLGRASGPDALHLQ